MAEGKRKAATRLSVDERVRQFREAVRAKYKHRCAACGLTNAAQKSINGRALSIHRVKPGSAYTVAGCVPLCQSCHSRSHGQARRGNMPVGPVVLPAKVAGVTCKIDSKVFGLLRGRAAELGVHERDLAAEWLAETIRQKCKNR